VHHVGILYGQFMMHGQRNIKLREFIYYSGIIDFSKGTTPLSYGGGDLSRTHNCGYQFLQSNHSEFTSVYVQWHCLHACFLCSFWCFQYFNFQVSVSQTYLLPEYNIKENCAC